MKAVLTIRWDVWAVFLSRGRMRRLSLRQAIKRSRNCDRFAFIVDRVGGCGPRSQKRQLARLTSGRRFRGPEQVRHHFPWLIRDPMSNLSDSRHLHVCYDLGFSALRKRVVGSVGRPVQCSGRPLWLGACAALGAR